MRKMKYKYIPSRKGEVKFNKTINTGLVIVISIVILMSLWNALIPEAQEAGDTLNDSNRCDAVGCHWNESRELLGGLACALNSSPEGNATVCQEIGQSIPLSSLFGGQGIIITLLMVVALFVGIRIAMGKDKK